MKWADIGGFALAISAGAYGGYTFSQNGSLATMDYVIILAMLAVAFYLAVILS
jgi:hypothetical protein